MTDGHQAPPASNPRTPDLQPYTSILIARVKAGVAPEAFVRVWSTRQSLPAVPAPRKRRDRGETALRNEVPAACADNTRV